MKKSIYNLLIIVLLGTWSCGIKRASSGSAAGPTKIFSKGADTLLCFAGPLEYESLNNRDQLSIDHTYLKVKGKSNPVTCAFSLISTDTRFIPESIVVSTETGSDTITSFDKYFAEGYDKKRYHYRYAFMVSDSLFYRWMQSSQPVITLNDRRFSGGKKFRKTSEVVFRKILFDLYN